MEPEGMDELQRELRQSLERIPAPPGLKRRVLQRREDLRTSRRRMRVVWLWRLAAAATLAALIVGALLWRNAERQRQGEEARREVIIALRITSRALQQMQSQLTAHNRNEVRGSRNAQE